jgi:hypothetical protein
MSKHCARNQTVRSKNPNGSAKLFYLKREFKYIEGDKFQLNITNSADAYGKVTLVKIDIKGHIAWQGSI